MNIVYHLLLENASEAKETIEGEQRRGRLLTRLIPHPLARMGTHFFGGLAADLCQLTSRLDTLTMDNHWASWLIKTHCQTAEHLCRHSQPCTQLDNA